MRYTFYLSDVANLKEFNKYKKLYIFSPENLISTLPESIIYLEPVTESKWRTVISVSR